MRGPDAALFVGPDHLCPSSPRRTKFPIWIDTISLPRSATVISRRAFDGMRATHQFPGKSGKLHPPCKCNTDLYRSSLILAKTRPQSSPAMKSGRTACVSWYTLLIAWAQYRQDTGTWHVCKSMFMIPLCVQSTHATPWPRRGDTRDRDRLRDRLGGDATRPLQPLTWGWPVFSCIESRS